MMESGLDGKVAIVLGGGRGIGRAIALAFAREGTRVSVVGPEALWLYQTVHAIEEAGGEGLAIPARLNHLVEITRLTSETIARFGRIDILVNAAEGLIGSEFGEGHQSMVQETLHRIFYNGLCLSLEVASHMISSGGGRIISILEEAEQEPAAILATTAINAGMRSLTSELARTLKPHHILVNMIDPRSKEVFHRGGQPGKWTKARARYSELVEGGRRQTPQEEIAEVTLFLASNEMDSLTGAEIDLYGAAPLNEWRRGAGLLTAPIIR